MNKILKFKKVIIAILAIIILISTIGNTVKAVADETKKVSLTIISCENSNGSEENIELEGVEFTISLVPESISSVDEAIEYVKNNNVISYTKTTPENGTVKFENLEQGRYLVQETDAPKNVLTKIESFLVDLPRANDDGNGWNYDVTVYPKNTTIYGKVILNQITQDGESLQGTKWELQKLSDEEKWKKYEYEGELTTDENGKIQIQNLEVGQYRLIQTEVPEGYILDKTEVKEFEIDAENINYEFTATNEKINFKKQILKDNATYGSSQSFFTTDECSWKITADVPNIINKMEVYKIRDEIPTGLKYNNNSLHVFALNQNGRDEEIPEKYFTSKIENNIIEVDFDTNQLQRYKKVYIAYNTDFSEDVICGEFVNKSYLTYTDYIDEDGTQKSEYTTSAEAMAYTGAVLVYKTDENGNPLKGATFRIAESKEGFKSDAILTNREGQPITATSDENGFILFKGLKYDISKSYWIEEIQAPSYEENGEIKYYNLLEKPVEIQVDSTSQNYSEENTTVVVNKKPFVLPMTGGTLSIISSVLGLCIIISVIFIKKRKSNCEK